MHETSFVTLQATAFCNIDCSYCYLPNRDSTDSMSLETLGAIFETLVSEQLVGESLSVTWHSGEPLVQPLAFFEEAFAKVRNVLRFVDLRQSVQTNAVLVTPQHAELFLREGVHVGVSIDGPAHLHDAARRDRAGHGTHARTLAGMRLLRDAGVELGAICVVTRASLAQPAELYSFFVEEQVDRVSFLVEEVQGVHTESTLSGLAFDESLRVFYETMLELSADKAGPRIVELEFLEDVVSRGGCIAGNNLVEPLGTLNFDARGGFGSFSPELLESSGSSGESFVVGNIKNGSIRSAFDSASARKIAAEVTRGVQACRETCEYFSFCGGGSPGSKQSEHGRLDITETENCRRSVKLLTETFLAREERSLGLA